MAIILDGTAGLQSPGVTDTGNLSVAGTTTLSGGITGTTVNLATNVTGTLPVLNGGTGVTTSTGSGDNVLSTTPVLSNPTINDGYTEEVYTANTSTAITLSLANGTIQNLTLTGICTITMPAAVAGRSFMMYLRTGAGGYTVTWSTVKWSGGTAPTLTATASRMDMFSFFSDGTNWYGVVAGQNYTP
jgi:hypothetical protein